MAETGFDPVKLSDLYSRTVTGHIFESLYCYDGLARPTQIRPLTAAAMPETADEFRTWTFRIRPGIFFADDPAFQGRPRELVAADYVYSLKRFADPANKSPPWGSVEEMGLVGLKALREEALQKRTPFDYEREIPGLRAIDRYTLQCRLENPRPRMHEDMADAGSYGAVAREVVQMYGEQIAAHPVGTGPLRAQVLAAQLAHRPRTQPGVPRALLRRRGRTRRRRRRGPGAAGALQGPAAAAGRRGRDLDHRGAAAALAGVPERAGRFLRARARGVHRHRHARPARSRRISPSAASAACASSGPRAR